MRSKRCTSEPIRTTDIHSCCLLQTLCINNVLPIVINGKWRSWQLPLISALESIPQKWGEFFYLVFLITTFSSHSFHDVWQCSRRPYVLSLNVSSAKSWSLPVMPEKRNGFTDVFTSEWDHSQGLWKSSGRFFFLSTLFRVTEQVSTVERVDNFTWWMNAYQ